MKKTLALLVMVWGFVACENPYDLVSESKYYDGNPFVSLSSEQALVQMSVNKNNHTTQAGVYQDSLVLSQAIDHAITIKLELVDQETQGKLGTHFSFQEELTIEAGKNYGTFIVRGIDMPSEELSKFKLSVRIKEVNDEQIIAGLYGTKKENEERVKRFKTYSFKK